MKNTSNLVIQCQNHKTLYSDMELKFHHTSLYIPGPFIPYYRITKIPKRKGKGSSLPTHQTPSSGRLCFNSLGGP